MIEAMKPLIAAGSIALALLLTGSCKTPSETNAANSTSVRDTTYEAGMLVFKVRDDFKTPLPPYDHSAPTLGDYPHLGDLLPTYRVTSIAPFTPQSGTPRPGRFYKIHFDTSVALDEFIAALDRIEIIEFTEKVPVNAPK
jgi:hypothetical protein